MISGIQRLDNIDWNFADVRTFPDVHNFHWFQARFIPQIPNILVDSLTSLEERVLDPFCGCGTTIVECLRLGRKSIGVDFHPLAALISKVKTTFMEPDYLTKKVNDFLKELHKTSRPVSEYNKTLDSFTDFSIDDKELFRNIPNTPILRRWYHLNTLSELAHIRNLILQENDVNLVDFYNVAFSSILKKSSSQEEHLGYVADNMLPKILVYKNSFKFFEEQLQFMVRWLLEFDAKCQRLNISRPELNKYCEIHKTDARNLNFIGDESVDLIVTSPPYPNVTDYTTAHRLSFYWFGWDLGEYKNIEIGARWKRGRKDALESYFEDMKICLKEMSRVLKVRSHLCIVLGNPKRKKVRVDTVEEFYNRVVEDLEFVLRKKIDRKVSFQKMPTKGVPEESILIFEKV